MPAYLVSEPESNVKHCNTYSHSRRQKSFSRSLSSVISPLLSREARYSLNLDLFYKKRGRPPVGSKLSSIWRSYAVVVGNSRNR